MPNIEQLAAELKDGLDEDREGAIARFAGKLIEFVGDGQLTDGEVGAICHLSDLLGVTHDEWCAIRDAAFSAATAAAGSLAELEGIRAFLYFTAEE